jgi:ribosomal protein S18 acetylase RimI-like enzyme
MHEIISVIPSEIGVVMALVNDAVREMENEGLYQWDDVYPDKNVFDADIAAKQLYCVKSDGLIAGIIALNEIQPVEYQNITWNDNGRPLVIHRLCIAPIFQKQGLARLLVQFAEKYARENHYSSIRLDAFTENTKALGLYDSSNYQRRGIVKFRKGNFYCYEKAL